MIWQAPLKVSFRPKKPQYWLSSQFATQHDTQEQCFWLKNLVFQEKSAPFLCAKPSPKRFVNHAQGLCQPTPWLCKPTPLTLNNILPNISETMNCTWMFPCWFSISSLIKNFMLFASKWREWFCGNSTSKIFKKTVSTNPCLLHFYDFGMPIILSELVMQRLI